MKKIGILNGDDIVESCINSNLVIDPFDKSYLQPTSYDISVSQVLENGSSYDFRSLRLEHLQFKNLLTRERMEFPLDIVGHISLRSTFIRKGLIMSLGRIEAGWCGRLVIEVFNAAEALVINNGERIATVEFVRLARPVSKGYNGEFQDFGI